MALTITEITRIRNDIGDTNTPSAFSDAEVQDAYDRTDTVTNERTRQSATRGILLRMLIAQANKFNDYTAGATSEKRSQVRAQLMDTYKMFYANAVEAVEGVGVTPVALIGVKSIPRAGRTYPSDWVEDCD